MSIDSNGWGEGADMGLFAAAKKSRRYHMSLELLERCLERTARHSRDAGRLEEAWLVEHGTMPAEKVRRLVDVGDVAPYFSIALVHGKGRRP